MTRPPTPDDFEPPPETVSADRPAEGDLDPDRNRGNAGKVAAIGSEQATELERAAIRSSGQSGKMFKNYVVLVSLDIAAKAARFLADTRLPRHFGEVVFGQINLAQSIASQGMVLATVGLDVAGVRDVSAGIAPAGRIAATIILLRSAMGIAVYAALLLVTLLVPQFRESAGLVALYSLSIMTGAATLGWVAQARGQFFLVGAWGLMTSLIYSGGVQLAIHFDWGPAAVPVGLLVAETITAAAVFVWILRQAGPLGRPFTWTESLVFLRQSAPIGLANVLRAVTFGSDVLVLRLFATARDVGIYSGAYKVFGLGQGLQSVYYTVLLPRYALLAAQSPQALDREIRAGLVRMPALSAVAAAVGAWLAVPVLTLLYGPRFEEAASALRILLVTLPVYLISIHYGAGLVALGKQDRDLACVTLAALAHITAKAVLAPVYGLDGTACGSLAGEIVLLILRLTAYRSTIRAISCN